MLTALGERGPEHSLNVPKLLHPLGNVGQALFDESLHLAARRGSKKCLHVLERESSCLGAGALAASMSTGDALVHAAGTILVKDLYKVWFKPDLDDLAERRLIRFLVIAIAGVAYYFAVFSNYSLVGLLLYSYGFLSQFFPLLLAASPRATCTTMARLPGQGENSAISQ